MRPRFQADADFNQKIVLGLRRRDSAVDIQDAQTGRVIGLADREVLFAAARLGRILVSHDRKTMPAEFTRCRPFQSSPGLIIVDQGLDIGQSIDELLLIWAATTAEEWRDKVGYIPI